MSITKPDGALIKESPVIESVTITFKFKGDHPTHSMVYDACEFQQERGISQQFKPGHFDIQGLVPNGQERITLKAWKGCPTFDSFQMVTEEWI